MTDKTVFLHVGPPKTGSTSIQGFFSNSADELGRHGVLYANAGRLAVGGQIRVQRPRGLVTIRGPGIAHHLLPWSMLAETEGLSAEQCWAELRQEIASTHAHTVVVSSEAFSRLPTASVNLVRDYLSDHTVRVIVYARDPFSRMLSDYKHRVKTGRYFDSFDDFLTEVQPLLEDYDGFIRRWDRAFESDNVIVRQFDTVRKEPGLEIDFLTTLGTDPGLFSGFLRAKPMNASPDTGIVHSLRVVNRIEHRLGRSVLLRPVFTRVRWFARSKNIIARNLNRLSSDAPLYDEKHIHKIDRLAGDAYRVLCARSESTDTSARNLDS